MRKVLILTVVALLCASPALAANESPVVKKVGKYVILTCTSPDTLAAGTADNFDMQWNYFPWVKSYDNDGAAAAWITPVLLNNLSATAGDSVNVYIHTSTDNTNWLPVVAVGNDGFALNGAEEKQSNIVSKVLGPYVRIGVKAVGSATTARSVKIAIPVEE